jgi:hypothetical protein
MIDDDIEDEDGEDEEGDREGTVKVKAHVRDLANKIASLLIRGRMAEFDLGREIDRVYATALYHEWPGFDSPPSFSEWTWRVLGFKERKARQMRDNFLNLSAMNLAPDSLARALRVGWSKLTVILRVARTEHDLLAWIDRVEDQKLTEDALTAEVRITAEKAGIEHRPVSQPGAKAARHEERLAAVDGDAVKSAPPMDDVPMPKTGRVYWKVMFEDEEACRIFVSALSAVKRRFGDMGSGKAAALMATSYMASLPRDDQGGAPVELEMLLKAIENTYRVRLGVVKASGAPDEAKATKSAKATKTNKTRRKAADMDD